MGVGTGRERRARPRGGRGWLVQRGQVDPCVGGFVGEPSRVLCPPGGPSLCEPADEPALEPALFCAACERDEIHLDLVELLPGDRV
jgi:hypothetical protein